METPGYNIEQMNNKSICRDRPCQERTPRAPTPTEDGNIHFRENPVLYTGVLWIGIVRRFLVPHTCGHSGPVLEAGIEIPAQWPVEAGIEIPAQRPVEAESMNHGEAGTSTPNRANSFQGLRPHPFTQLDSAKLEDEAAKIQSDQKTEKNDQTRLPSGHELRIQQSSAKKSDNTVMEERKVDMAAGKWLAIGACTVMSYALCPYRSRLVRTFCGGTAGVSMAIICFPDHARRYNQKGVEFSRQCVLIGMDKCGIGSKKSPRDEDSGKSKSPNPDQNKSPHPPQNMSPNVKSSNYFEAPIYNPDLDEKLNNVSSLEEGRIHHSEPEVCADSQQQPGESTSENNKKLSSSKYDQEMSRKHLPPTKLLPYSPALPSPPKNRSDINESTQSEQKLHFVEECETDFQQTDR